MSKRTTLILLGLLIVITPFVGLPYSYLMWVLPILGLLVAYLGYSRRSIRMPAEDPALHEGPES